MQLAKLIKTSLRLYITDFYGSDLNSSKLEMNLLTFGVVFKIFKQGKVILKDVIDFMKQPGHSLLMSEVSIVLRLILVLPATNATSELVFSALITRIKNYLTNLIICRPQAGRYLRLRILQERLCRKKF